VGFSEVARDVELTEEDVGFFFWLRGKAAFIFYFCSIDGGLTSIAVHCLDEFPCYPDSLLRRRRVFFFCTSAFFHAVLVDALRRPDIKGGSRETAVLASSLN
jgi:hypothetical protein